MIKDFVDDEQEQERGTGVRFIDRRSSLSSSINLGILFPHGPAAGSLAQGVSHMLLRIQGIYYI